LGKENIETIWRLMVCTLVLLPGVLFAGERFDGKWLTKMTCPAKGSTAGYTWQFPSLVKPATFAENTGTAGEPGYLLIEGKIKEEAALSCLPTV